MARVGPQRHRKENERQNYTKKNLAHCQFVHHKSHIKWSDITDGLPKLKTSEYYR
jgi:hypothetical protein